MSKVDPQLLLLQQDIVDAAGELESLEDTGLESTDVGKPLVRVLLQYTGNPAELEALGFKIRTVAGDVISGLLPLDQLEAVTALPELVKIESTRPLTAELDVSAPEIKANTVWQPPYDLRGTGVIVGIIDSGIDFTHRSFQNADGTSRILAIWDQTLTPGTNPAGVAEETPADRNANESQFSGFDYGVEYTKADIDAALKLANPLSRVRHQDAGGHGTHVTGIAAGNGSVAGNGQPTLTYSGVAPEADLIIVFYTAATDALGDSANALDAANYIFAKARQLNRPAVINLSQGDNLGPHDGTSLLERGLDNLLMEDYGRALVKSAGNAASDNIHAGGNVTAGGSQAIQFSVPASCGASSATSATIDIWYDGDDRFNVTVTSPDGTPTPVVIPNNTSSMQIQGNTVSIISSLDDPRNHDNQIYVRLSRSPSQSIVSGTWTITLQGTTVKDGRFDAWIERGTCIPAFTSHREISRTISIPGTSEEAIVVASYKSANRDSTGALTAATPDLGDISTFSSLGPTRDGRLKPDLGAPGQWIMSARAGATGTNQYQRMQGTSMATPQITGVIALMLQRNRYLTQRQLKSILAVAARADTFTNKDLISGENDKGVPNETWGFGKVDAQKAIECGLWYPAVLHIMAG